MVAAKLNRCAGIDVSLLFFAHLGALDQYGLQFAEHDAIIIGYHYAGNRRMQTRSLPRGSARRPTTLRSR